MRSNDGTVLLDALVTVTETRGGLQRSSATQRDGTFSVPLLPAGSYDVLIEHLGYRPKRLRGVLVASGGSVLVPVRLTPAAPGQVGPEAEDFVGRLSGMVPGVVDRLSLSPRAPDVRRDLWDAARRSSAVGTDLSSEGLPASLGSVYWDGVAMWGARHPVYAADDAAGAVPAVALGAADLVVNGVDVEWGGAAGSMLSLHSARGAGALRVLVAADATSDALSTSKYFDTGVVPNSTVRATALLSGPIIRDSAAFVVGVDVQRIERPRPALWPANALAGALVDLARDSFAVDLSAYVQPGVIATQSTTVFGRFDWRAARNHTVSVHGVVARLETDLDAMGNWVAGSRARLNAQDFAGMAAVNSVLGARWWQELRLSFSRSTREYDDADVPPTRIVDAGLTFGGDPSLTADVRRTTVQATDALHVTVERHRVKIGGGVTLTTMDQTFADLAGGAFGFAGTGELAGRRGVYRQSVGSPPVATFTTPEIFAFVQDRWDAAPGLELSGGVRFEAEPLPRDEVARNDSLRVATGLDNGAFPRRLSRIAPRLGLRWDVGGRGAWVVRGAAGVYHGSMDPALLAELITGDGGVRGRGGVGDLGAWPAAPDSTAAPLLGPRFSMLGPSFATPRSTRMSLGLSRALGVAALHVTGTYRHTDFLTRRVDLNRLAAAAGVDQYGRPLYGTLVQQGSLLAGQSNRRFTAFDRIWGLNADGASDHWGLTIALERDASRGPRLLGSYTYSSTTDNWLAARGGAAATQLSPFPERLGGQDWADGRSDLDVPHRVAAGVELRLPGPFAPLLAGLYRFESGTPFTPGFRAGVDANGDGADDNDPAFVDAAASGMSALMDRWDCLRTQVGDFAARNSCREPGRHRLDLRLTLEPLRLGGAPVQLVIEGLNLVETDAGLRDHALFLVDRTGAVTTNLATGVVTVPLIANPAFGDVLARRSPGRALRVGLRLGGGS